MDATSSVGVQVATELDGLSGLRAFVRVAEAGGFTAAARRHAVTPSALAKAVMRFEATLGITLFVRTTRTVRLTDEGAAMLERAREVLNGVDEIEALAAGANGAPRGHLRITVPVAFGEFLLARALPGFLEAHPAITLSVELEDRTVDLLGEGFDLAVRIARRLPDSGLIATDLGPHRIGTYASPSYLSRMGSPERPEDLPSHHRMIAFTPSGEAAPLPWTFDCGAGPTTIVPRGRMTLNSNNATLAAVESGHGIAALPDYVARAAMERGTLAPVLRDLWASDGRIFAVRPPMRTTSPKVRAFVAFLRSIAAEP